MLLIFTINKHQQHPLAVNAMMWSLSTFAVPIVNDCQRERERETARIFWLLKFVMMFDPSPLGFHHDVEVLKSINSTLRGGRTCIFSTQNLTWPTFCWKNWVEISMRQATVFWFQWQSLLNHGAGEVGGEIYRELIIGSWKFYQSPRLISTISLL